MQARSLASSLISMGRLRKYCPKLATRADAGSFVIQDCYATLELVWLHEGGDPNGIRTRVTAVKGRCPRPLDDRVGERQISGRRPALQVAFVAGRAIKHRTLRRPPRGNFFNECRRSHSSFSMRLNDTKRIGRQLFSLGGATQ